MLAYIHIPYCDSRCHYCAFNSYVGRFDTRTSYMEALHMQCRYEIERFGSQKGSIKTLFIGGGTPSTIVPKLYEPVFELLKPYLDSGAEITIEANPNSASTDWLSGMHKLGVNRVSFGVQSFDANKLKILGRAHTPQQAKDAIISAKSIGFEHISLDLIYNVAGDTKELLGHDIEQAFELPIDHISAYELTIESNTPFASAPQIRQESDEIAFFVAEEIKSRDFEHYEISNFGNYKSRHNIGYWQHRDYMGIGAGAVGFHNNIRYYPLTDIDQYIDNPSSATEEKLNSSEILTEQVFLGLRSIVGIDLNILGDDMIKRANTLVNESKLTQVDRQIYNNDFFLADEIALYILGD